MSQNSHTNQNVPASPQCVVPLAQVQPQTVQWLWPNRIPLGKLTLLAGDPGMGKSFLTLDLAARVSRGAAWPDDPKNKMPHGSVLLLNAEDGLEDTVRPRLEKAGAKLDRIVALTGIPSPDGEMARAVSLRRDLLTLRDLLRGMPECRLVIIDPISAYLANIDSNCNAEVRSLLLPIAHLAAMHQVAFVVVTHLNKNTAGRAMYRAMGSLAFVAAARAAWGVVPDPGDEQRRLLLPVKINLAPQTKGLAFRLFAKQNGEIPTVQWDKGAVEETLDEVLGANIPPDQRDDQEKTDYVDDWLREQLANGPRSRQDLFLDKLLANINDSQLYRAARRLGINKIKNGQSPDTWQWQLPEED